MMLWQAITISRVMITIVYICKGGIQLLAGILFIAILLTVPKLWANVHYFLGTPRIMRLHYQSHFNN